MKSLPGVVLLLLAFTLVSEVAAPPVYTLSVSPSVPVGCGGTVTLTLSLYDAQSNRQYNVLFEVRKPNGTGQAIASRVINTNGAGTGSTSVPYPDPSFTPVIGTVATDVPGVYTVIANQTGPTNIGVVTTAQFTVSCTLTVVVSEPVAGSRVERGVKMNIRATVSDLTGPISTATVKANTPTNGELILSQTSPGAYSIDYRTLVYDPLGPWTILVQASDPRGNSGTSNPVTVSVVKSELIVDVLAAYNSKGVPATDFSPGETVYPFFRMRYSSGDLLTTGQYRVVIKNPSGRTIANLTAVYDSLRFGFYTPTGFTISSEDPGGSWSVVIDTDTLNDGFGNTGPTIANSVRVQVLSSPWGYIPIIIGGLVALLGGVVVFKRYRTSLEGFDHLLGLMGGNVPRASSLLLLGDPGAGKTILSYQLLWEELEAGRQCALLSYDAFPEDVQRRMRDFGWDIIPYLRKGHLKILDCYSGLTGEGQGAIRDPSDLTELNIQVTSLITKAKGGAVTIVLDSLTPVFNGVDAKQAISFIQTIGAKVKKTGGLFILTASQGAIPADPVAKIKSIVDGIIELGVVRAGRHVSRFLSVVKMGRRKISPEQIPIEIDRDRGVVFRVSIFKTLKDQIAKVVVAQEPDTVPKAGGVSIKLPAEWPRTSNRSVVAKSSISPETSKAQHDPSGNRGTGTQRRERNEP